VRRGQVNPDEQPDAAVIVLTGPPGAGKTVTAQLIADRMTPSVHLHADDFWHIIRRGAIPPNLPEAHQQNEIVTQIVAEVAFAYAAGGYNVACDGIVGPWFLDRFRHASQASGITLHYVVLRPTEATALQRAATRSTQSITPPHTVRLLHDRFSHLADLETHVLDTTHMTAEDAAERVLAGIASGRFRLSP
jgi:hypothetical protein